MTERHDKRASMPIVDLLADWDPQAFETQHITPVQAQSVVLLWADVPAPDGGTPDLVVWPVANALTSLGEVCFRQAGPIPPRARALAKVKAHRWPWSNSWNIVASSDPAGVIELFDAGWSQGSQTALVAAQDDDRARQVLKMNRFADLVLTEEELLCSAIVDGAGMLIAAHSAPRLDHAIAVVEREFARAGMRLRGS